MTHLHSQSGSPGRRRRGFTLVELMVAIAIVAIIATFILSAMYAAQEAARERRTQVLINKIHQQLMLRWEDYAYRRVPIDAIYLAEQGLVTGFSAEPISNELGMDNMRAIQLGAKRELMRMEMPDKFSDLFFTPEFCRNPDGSPVRNTMRNAYVARVDALMPGYDLASATPDDALSEVLDQFGGNNQSAECLYLLLSTVTSNESVFNERDIADTNGNGLPEFVDGWGRPIQWIRWPAGFISDAQPGESRTNRFVVENRDPDDPWLADSILAGLTTYDVQSGFERGYRLTPLVVSAGRDGEFGLAFRWSPTVGSHSDPYSAKNDEEDSSIIVAQPGEPNPGESAHLDNIHNHLLSGLE